MSRDGGGGAPGQLHRPCPLQPLSLPWEQKGAAAVVFLLTTVLRVPEARLLLVAWSAWLFQDYLSVCGAFSLALAMASLSVPLLGLHTESPPEVEELGFLFSLESIPSPLVSFLFRP